MQKAKNYCILICSCSYKCATAITAAIQIRIVMPLFSTPSQTEQAIPYA